MSARNIILLLVAIMVAGATAYFARGLMTRPPQQVVVQAPAPPPSTGAILIAAADLPAGTLLLEEHLKWQPWPENSMNPNFIKQADAKLENYVGAVARRGINNGQPIMPSQIVKPGDRGFLAAVLKPGMRAVSVGVGDVSGISHLILPGDRIDLLLTQTVLSDGGGETASGERRAAETVLENIRVLAVDTTLDDLNNKAIDGKTITIEVTPKQAEMISVAVELGRIVFSMRGLENNGFDRAIVSSGNDAQDTATSDATDATGPADTGATTSIVVGGPEDFGDELDRPWRGEGYTLDSEVSRLIAPFSGTKVHVFHGNQAEELTFK